MHSKAKSKTIAELMKRFEFTRQSTNGVASINLNNSPSAGRWLHRRKNDGSFNRVPQGFYPRVWKILSHSTGFKINQERLPRDPIVSEKTPEEFNFAIAVESFLDHLADPAERQIAVECLTVIADMDEEAEAGKHPARSRNKDIDLVKIIEGAVELYQEICFASIREKEQLTPEQEKKVARQYFFDLPFDDKYGTATFLRASAARLLA
jgi:hypothetical protein